MKNIYHILPAVFFASVFSSCQNGEENLGQADGRIVLNNPSAETFVAVNSRTVQNLTDFDGFTFLLSGTDSQGEPVSRNILFQKENGTYTAIVPAGTYSLTAENKSAAISGTGMPYYQGTSSQFTFTPGGTAHVTIDLGTPQNARVNIVQGYSFSSLYDLKEITLNDGNTRDNKLSSDGVSYVMIPDDGIISYTIKATAKAGSHVSDLPSTGVTGSISVAAGNEYTINLTAQSISDLLIEMGDGEYGGVFE